MDKPEWWSSDEWSTPSELVHRFALEFGPFTLDVCARPENAKAASFYTLNEDGLTQPWTGSVWLNPPYSDIGPWLAKARTEIENGCRIVCALIPSATDTAWWHDHVIGHAELRFIRGRVRFIGWQGTPIPAPRTPSVLAIYRKPNHAFSSPAAPQEK